MKKIIIFVILILILSLCGCKEKENIHTHTFSPDWTIDENYHWHDASCDHDVIDGKSLHSWDSGIVSKEPTIIEEGEITYTCVVCGAKKTESIDKVDANKVLSDAIKDSNFANVRIVEEYYENDELLSDLIYCIDGKYIKYIDSYDFYGELYTDYWFFTLDDENEIISSLYSEDDDSYYEHSISIFYLLYDFYYLNYDFNVLDSNDFTLVEEGHYQAKPDLVDALGKAFMGDYTNDKKGITMTINSFDLFALDGKISKIDICYNQKCTDEKDPYDYNNRVSLVFSDYGILELAVPEIKEYVYEYSLEELYELEPSDVILTGGYVTGTSVGYLFINDYVDSAVIYLPGYDFSDYEIGAYVNVNGLVEINNGWLEIVISSVDDIEYDDSYIDNVRVRNYDYFSLFTKYIVSDVINLDNLIVESINLLDENSNIIFKDDSDNKISLVIESGMQEFANILFASLEVGDYLSLDNIAVIICDGKYQLFLINETKIREYNGLGLNYNKKTVNIGEDSDNLFDDLKVYYYDGGKKQLLNATDYQIEGEYDLNEVGTYDLKVKYHEDYIMLRLAVHNSNAHVANYKTLDEFGRDNNLVYGIPQEGEVHVLVIPILFSNSTISATDANTLLEKAFNGSSSDTGWHSLNSYYLEASFGNLNLKGDIMPAYDTKVEYDLKRGYSGIDDYKYLVDSLKYYDETIDYNMYDQNNDGFIDTVYLIYLAPYDEDAELWWAYNYEYEDKGEIIELDGKRIDWYLWMSIELFNDPICYYYDDNGYYAEDTLGVSINCSILIHETGHAFGLEDYYPTNGDDLGGLGQTDMMDSCQGDHNPFSKALLGWINPTVVTTSDYSANLRSFAEYGDAIFIAKEGNGTYFDEFYVICFYTPTGVNELEAGKQSGMFSTSGVLIYHVNSKLKSNYLESGGVIYVYAYNNCNLTTRLIQIVEADGNNSIDETFFADNSDLFQASDSLTPKWHDGSLAGFTIKVKSIEDGQATIEIDFE